mgnify:CR=1 FL=1
MGLEDINKYKLKTVYKDKLDSFIDNLDTETKKNIEDGNKKIKW